jgi:hypothetical protein
MYCYGRFGGHVASVFTVQICNWELAGLHTHVYLLATSEVHEGGVRKWTTVRSSRSHFNTENGGGIFIRNKDIRLQDYMMSQPRSYSKSSKCWCTYNWCQKRYLNVGCQYRTKSLRLGVKEIRKVYFKFTGSTEGWHSTSRQIYIFRKIVIRIMN